MLVTLQREITSCDPFKLVFVPCILNMIFDQKRACSHLGIFLTVDDRFFFSKIKSWPAFWLQNVFCCYSNSCNSSLVLCVHNVRKNMALALAFEVNGERMSVHNNYMGKKTVWCSHNLVQELRLDDARVCVIFDTI